MKYWRHVWRGDESIDYVPGAREGQTMIVTFKPSQAETVTAAKEGDLWLVSVSGFMHYRIPEAVIVGG